MTTPDDASVLQGPIDLIETLNAMGAERTKPVELMISALNMPIDEDGCRRAGHLLDQLTSQPQFDGIPDGVEELAKRWQRHEEVGRTVEGLRCAQANRPKKEPKPSPQWWPAPAILAGLGAVLVIYALLDFTIGVTRFEYGKAPTWVGLIVGGVFFLSSVGFAFGQRAWRNLGLNKAYQEEKEKADAAEFQALDNLREAVRDALNSELAGGLEGPDGIVTRGQWFTKYPLTADNEQFKWFRDNEEATLSKIVERFSPGDESTIINRFKNSVGDLIMSNDWHRRDGHLEIAVIPFGHQQNMDKFGMTETDFPPRTADTTTRFQPVSGQDFALSCLYIVMRSPVGAEHLANHNLYEQQGARASDEEKSRRDPDPRLKKS